MKTIKDISEYHSVFGFPIIDYYQRVGFNFDVEPFEDLAVEFMELYRSNNNGNCKLHSGAEETLKTIRDANITQVLLSASAMDDLLSQVSAFDIKNYFDELLGLTDIYAKSKIDIGLEYINRNGITNAVLIGDTKHDFEVAQALGVDCLLIPNGHQSEETLQTCGVPVLDDISDVVGFIQV